MRGEITTYFPKLRYGFITPLDEDESEKIFFHASSVLLGEDGLREGLLCDYDVGEGTRGPKAIDVIVRPHAFEMP